MKDFYSEHLRTPYQSVFLNVTKEGKQRRQVRPVPTTGEGSRKELSLQGEGALLGLAEEMTALLRQTTAKSSQGTQGDHAG